MKNIKLLSLGLFMGLAAGLTGCQAEMDAPADVAPVATMHANTTLADFKAAFEGVSVLCPMKDEQTATPYIIKGRVISSDATGNIYKNLVIQDETAALTLSINQGSMYVDYRVGQEVVINATGLYIGYYRGLQQLGWLGTPYDGVDQLNFMAWDLFRAHSEKNGFPNNDFTYVSQDDAVWPSENPYCVVTSIGSLPSAGEEYRKMQSQLVEFRNVHFVDGGKEIYAPYQESVNRYLEDAQGNQIIVRNSGYSTFYNQTLPEGDGTVRGILSLYGSDWQLLLRSLDDVMISQHGQQDDPYTIEEVMESQNTGMSGWTKGYIVGSVRAGVQTVSSSADIIFGADADLDNNIVIAASADETDYAKCIVLELPQGTALRQYANLADNPGVYKREITIYGAFESIIGAPGVSSPGSVNDFLIEGVEIGNGGNTPSQPDGDGSQASPYTVTQIQNSTADSNAWVTGYVVGYVSDINWASTAVFGNQATEGSTNYTNGTNIILSTVAPGDATLANSIPVGLSTQGDVRANLAISKNPEIYGKLVKVKGDITKYFGQRGIKNVTEYEIVGGSTPVDPSPVDPTPAGGTIYSALGESDASINWIFENMQLPAGMSQIWSWKEYNGKHYLNGSGYSGGAKAAQADAYSPEIDLDGYTKVTVEFEHAAKFQTTLKTLCHFMIREAGTDSWTYLTIPTWPGTEAWTFVSSGSIDISEWAGMAVEIGFHYGSTEQGADTWEIRNLVVKAE